MAMGSRRSPLRLPRLASVGVVCFLVALHQRAVSWLFVGQQPRESTASMMMTPPAASVTTHSAAEATASALAGSRLSGTSHARLQLSRSAMGLSSETEAAVALGGQTGDAVLHGLLGLVALYIIMSGNEYMYHRYFQHLGINKLQWSRWLRNTLNLPTYKGDGHVEHHRETLDDMSLGERGETVLDQDPFRGTAFPWWATVAMTFSVFVPAYPILSMLSWSGPSIVVVVLAVMLLHALVWNSLHPHMHGLPDVPLSHGAPANVLAGFRDSALFSALRVNHEGHHRAEGAHGNYNVCCPLMDVVVGTYVGVIPAKTDVQSQISGAQTPANAVA